MVSYDFNYKGVFRLCPPTIKLQYKQFVLYDPLPSKEPPVNYAYSKKSKDQESRNLCLTRLESYQLIIPLH